jgi:hypothetical protein
MAQTVYQAHDKADEDDHAEYTPPVRQGGATIAMRSGPTAGEVGPIAGDRADIWGSSNLSSIGDRRMKMWKTIANVKGRECLGRSCSPASLGSRRKELHHLGTFNGIIGENRRQWSSRCTKDAQLQLLLQRATDANRACLH